MDGVLFRRRVQPGGGCGPGRLRLWRVLWRSPLRLQDGLQRPGYIMTWPFPPFPMPVPAKAPPIKFNPDNYEESPF